MIQYMKISNIPQLRGKNLIISIETEKAFDKIQHPLMIKTPKKIRIHRGYLSIIKAVYMRNQHQTILSVERL